MRVRIILPVVALVFFFCSGFLFPWIMEVPESLELSAGRQTNEVKMGVRNLWGGTPLWGKLQVIASDEELISLKWDGDSLLVASRFLEGRGWLEVRAFPLRRHIAVTVEPDTTDSDGDGFPDVVKLRQESDRVAFRKRFVDIAIAQLERKSPSWRDQDCSGLVRFAYREALKTPDVEWFQQIDAPVTQTDRVSAYRYPRIPLLGERLFRVRPGHFSPERVEEDFSVFASAFYLFSYNVVPLQKGEREAKPGDLLFFYHPYTADFPYHVMIYTGAGEVVYHTGPTEEGAGKISRSTLHDLARHRDPRWRPIAGNRAFLGFFRWKILT